ncbi:hypothetical protein VFPPC_17771 [Pochonia chlamydosporia 170]|uniref:Uncharacterized protein n=1 Tax=Pochonia chlamydosporia 170 TaxID=1380566 RepID=A0A219AQL1_METCM|nr:hypothetical protein VFPPC_17771 [Pochonia chlamydosporia 170]OWT43053.1 hypothetical protein VFPPC_17771 [Pochonia chlamydosporia 170]
MQQPDPQAVHPKSTPMPIFRNHLVTVIANPDQSPASQEMHLSPENTTLPSRDSPPSPRSPQRNSPSISSFLHHVHQHVIITPFLHAVTSPCSTNAPHALCIVPVIYPGKAFHAGLAPELRHQQFTPDLAQRSTQSSGYWTPS